MGDKACTIRTRKFLVNKLLGRKQFVSILLSPTPECRARFSLSVHRPGAHSRSVCRTAPGAFAAGKAGESGGRRGIAHTGSWLRAGDLAQAQGRTAPGVAGGHGSPSEQSRGRGEAWCGRQEDIRTCILGE